MYTCLNPVVQERKYFKLQYRSAQNSTVLSSRRDHEVMVVSPSLDTHFMELLGAVVETYQQVDSVKVTLENIGAWS